MELRHLRYFVAVAEEGGVTRAAARLGLQQPPLSQQLAALEREVGTALFDRLPRGMELTPAGEAFLLEARAALERAELGVTRARLAARGQIGRLSVGLTTAAALHPLISEQLGRYHRAHPAVTLDVREGNASDLTEALTRSELDLAFMRATVARPLGLRFHELLREPLVVVLPDGHRLQGGSVRLEQLRDERFILVRRPAAPGLYAELLDRCRAIGIEPVVSAEVGRMLTAVNLVAAGLGIALVPSSVSALRPPGVSYVPLDDPGMPDAPLTAAWRDGEARPAVTALLALVQAHGAPA